MRRRGPGADVRRVADGSAAQLSTPQLSTPQLSTEQGSAEQGSAVVEFLAVALILLVPVVYLVLVLGRVQAAMFAADGAAREAGRVYVQARTADDGARAAVSSVGIALDDQGFDDVDPGAALAVECSAPRCLRPGSDVATRVSFGVPLPFVPSFVRSVVPLEIPVSAEHVTPVDRFREAP